MEEEKIQQFASDFFRVEEEIGSVIIGQKELVRNVLTAMVAGGNVLLEGMPGLGKTQLVKAVGDAVDLEFSRIQFTPDLMPADVTGTTVMNREENGNMSFVFRKGPIFANLVLADEINRATPKTQSALLEAMQDIRSLAAARPAAWKNRFLCWRPRTHWKQKGHILCRKPRWTVFCSSWM